MNEPTPRLMPAAGCHHHHHVELTCTQNSQNSECLGPAQSALLRACIPALSGGTSFSPFHSAGKLSNLFSQTLQLDVFESGSQDFDYAMLEKS